MGIAVKELLALDYFKDFYVVAGRKGVYKEIQGITMLEAPDGFRWSVGKELILSSGYAIMQDPDCIRRAFEEGGFQRAAAIMLKRERYLPQIPKQIMELCDKYEVPLISMPFSIPWMEVMSQINVAVMNRTVRRFRIHNSDAIHTSQQTYKVQKIQRILQAVESEMNFPAYLYDVNEKKGYYSSANFKRISESFGLDNAEYCVPTRPHTIHTLCDYIQMKRIRLTEPDDTGKPRISWIQIPIIMNDVTQAYFVVMESRELLDYYDEYSIRIAFLMLQAVYEQIMVTRNMGNIGFENFILYALNSADADRDKLVEQANVQGISMDTRYVCAVFRQRNDGISARNERKVFADAFRVEHAPDMGKLAFLGENEGALLFEIDAAVSHDCSKLLRFLEEFKYKVETRISGMRLEFG
ncbi:MAG: PucR family transcriptional regulator ligand-binding domain-containing protein, partial [Lachnospiraceae bacterium]|nr:PucR family transcriptional regulator ligand-binding domain-containing protein [Lachnospiraceae bacterium]